MNEKIWQLIEENNWIFGRPLRGIVRQIEAQIWFSSAEGGWVWTACSDEGSAKSRKEAIESAEKEMERMNRDWWK